MILRMWFPSPPQVGHSRLLDPENLQGLPRNVRRGFGETRSNGLPGNRSAVRAGGGEAEGAEGTPEPARECDGPRLGKPGEALCPGGRGRPLADLPLGAAPGRDGHPQEVGLAGRPGHGCRERDRSPCAEGCERITLRRSRGTRVHIRFGFAVRESCRLSHWHA